MNFTEKLNRLLTRMKGKRPVRNAFITGVVVFALLLVSVTYVQVQPLPLLQSLADRRINAPLKDRNGVLLTTEHGSDWNIDQFLSLAQMPTLLSKAFLLSEDQRFYQHGGVDWLARLHALVQNSMARRTVRGASTISEQVVRMVHPRPRSIWSKWLEGFEAHALEQHNSKSDILEFYFNQLPYASEQRGVVQAAHHYFNRDPDTLSLKEQLALVVLVRAPSSFDLRHHAGRIDTDIAQLARHLIRTHVLDAEQWRLAATEPLIIKPEVPPVQVYHFAHYVRSLLPPITATIATTLDLPLQMRVQALIDQRLQHLGSRDVHNAAVLVVDHVTNEILAWAVSGSVNRNTPGAFYDAVQVPRQPGSTLKPFIYASAMEKGWTAATLIHDEPLQQAVGNGLHTYHNFSRTYYGEVSVREALANSLNVPAVKAIQYAGDKTVLDKLTTLGISDLQLSANVYGDGLALGNGEVSLLQLVQAYSALAHDGVIRPLRVLRDAPEGEAVRVFSSGVASIIADILADNNARQLEFGNGNALHFSAQTAIKTGTSNDHRDAWTLAFNHRYLVGIWMGNLDRRPMKELTGSTGPALVVRSILTELGRKDEAVPLSVNTALTLQHVCVRYENGSCAYRDEWFIPGTEPVDPGLPVHAKVVEQFQIRKPTNHLEMAMDPRVPDERERFMFELAAVADTDIVDWYLNGQLLGKRTGAHYLWTIARGRHELQAKLHLADGRVQASETITFDVK